MIFQALSKKRRYLITLATTIFLIIYSCPLVTNSFPFTVRSNVLSFVSAETIVVDNFRSTADQKQSIDVFQQLNLTTEQQQQIKQIHIQYRQQIRTKKHQIVKLQQQLSDMMVGTDPVELLRAKNQQLNLLKQEIGTLRFESMLATRKILTPHQREEFRKLVNLRSTQD